MRKDNSENMQFFLVVGALECFADSFDCLIAPYLTQQVEACSRKVRL